MKEEAVRGFVCTALCEITRWKVYLYGVLVLVLVLVLVFDDVNLKVTLVDYIRCLYLLRTHVHVAVPELGWFMWLVARTGTQTRATKLYRGARSG
jgi:hypothetical protein